MSCDGFIGGKRGERGGEHSGVPYLNGGGRVNAVCCPAAACPSTERKGGGTKALLELSIGGTTPEGEWRRKGERKGSGKVDMVGSMM